MKTSPGRKLFGTDGIRGNADVELTPDLVREIGRAVALASRQGALGKPVDRPRFVLGRDTRVSGPKLEQAFIDGACAAGADVMTGDILPTAGIAFLVTLFGFDAGVVVSASHNPPADNGIKLFGPGGWKLSSEAEGTIESLVTAAEPDPVEAGESGELVEARQAYVAHLVAAAFPAVAGMRVVVDCANGAAAPIVPRVFAQLGVQMTAMNTSLDGKSINDGCGALHPDVVCAESREAGAIGITFDGDADRVLMSDEDGRLLGGDELLALIASDLKRDGHLSGDAIVATVMANQALRRWCTSEEIELVETAVGDRYVLEAMRSKHIVVGGEQSGHIICLDRATTGDGILVALRVLNLVATSGRKLRDLVPFAPFPQVLVNVAARDRDFESNEAVRTAIDEAEAMLGEAGRVLVRASGTEPLIRVMVEASEVAVASEVAEQVATVVRAELGDG